MIAENVKEVQKKIEESCCKAGRNPEEVTLIAVSKTKPIELLKECYQTGIRDFGENKVQELVEKYDQMPSDVRWHLIGHLQTNKVKYIIDKVYMIHSVDSLKLATEISKQAVKHGITVQVLIEVNVAQEDSKFGITPQEAPQLVREIAALPGICVKGLMTVAPYVEEAEENRQYFVNLHQLSVDIEEKNIDNREKDELSIESFSMEVLSMGMTGDYQVAIEEGATCVRVGTGIFGARDYATVQ